MYIYTLHAVEALIAGVIKGLWSVVSVSIVSFFVPLTPFLLFTLALVVADTITGVRAAKIRKEEVRSKGIRRSVTKLTEYYIAILLTKGFEDVFLADLPINLAYVTAALIALSEIKSVFENIHETTGVELWHVFSEKVFSIIDIFKKKP